MITAGVQEAFRWAYRDIPDTEPVLEPEVDAVLHGELLHCDPSGLTGATVKWYGPPVPTPGLLSEQLEERRRDGAKALETFEEFMARKYLDVRAEQIAEEMQIPSLEDFIKSLYE